MNTVLIIDRITLLVGISFQSENIYLSQTRTDDLGNSAVIPVLVAGVHRPQLESSGVAGSWLRYGRARLREDSLGVDNLGPVRRILRICRETLWIGPSCS